MTNIHTNNLPKAIFLMGPTASGKTVLAIKLSKILPVKLINVDSALIYRGMDIGTAKPDIDVLRITPYRLLNILDPSQTYSAANFCRDALTEMDKIVSDGYIPLLVGGSMFYFKSLLHGLSLLPAANKHIRTKIKQKIVEQGAHCIHKQLKKIDPVSAARIHQNDLQRLSRAVEVFLISGKTLTELTNNSNQSIPYQIYQFATIPSNRIILHKKIEYRFYKMLDYGFEKEVKKLFDRQDLHPDMPSIRCIGYRQMWSWFEGKISYNDMIHQSIYATRQLAKRQITWLRNWTEEIHWLDNEKQKNIIDQVLHVVGNIATK